MSVVEKSSSPIRASGTENQKDHGKQLSFIFSSVYLLYAVRRIILDDLLDSVCHMLPLHTTPFAQALLHVSQTQF